MLGGSLLGGGGAKPGMVMDGAVGYLRIENDADVDPMNLEFIIEFEAKFGPWPAPNTVQQVFGKFDAASDVDGIFVDYLEDGTLRVSVKDASEAVDETIITTATIVPGEKTKITVSRVGNNINILFDDVSVGTYAAPAALDLSNSSAWIFGGRLNSDPVVDQHCEYVIEGDLLLSGPTPPIQMTLVEWMAAERLSPTPGTVINGQDTTDDRINTLQGIRDFFYLLISEDYKFSNVRPLDSMAKVPGSNARFAQAIVTVIPMTPGDFTAALIRKAPGETAGRLLHSQITLTDGNATPAVLNGDITTFEVDGVDQIAATRDDLHTLFDDDGWHVVKVAFSTVPAFDFPLWMWQSGGAGSILDGEIAFSANQISGGDGDQYVWNWGGLSFPLASQETVDHVGTSGSTNQYRGSDANDFSAATPEASLPGIANNTYDTDGVPLGDATGKVPNITNLTGPAGIPNKTKRNVGQI